MAWMEIKDLSGKTWLVDWRRFETVVSAYAYMHVFTKLASLKSQSIGLGKSVKVVDIDHAALMERSKKTYNRLFGELVVEMRSNPANVFRRLCALRRATAQLREKRADIFDTASASAMGSIAIADVCVSLAQIVRDTAITTISIVAMPAGGTTALAGVIVSAGSTALAKYQDTGKGGAAIVAGMGSLIVSGVGAVGGLLKEGGRAAEGVFIVGGVMFDAMFELAGASTEGKSGSDAFKAAFLKGIFSSLGVAFDSMSPLAKKFDDVFANVKKDADALAAAHGFSAAGRSAHESAKKALEVGVGKAAEMKPGASNRPKGSRLDPGPDAEYIAATVFRPA